MAQQEFDPYALLDTLRSGGDVDIIRQAVELVLQALIEAEATGVIGAAPHERSEERQNYRNGHRPRLLSTKAGDISLKIPKLRSGSFFPEILERRRRVDHALYAVVMEAYVHGVSTRKVDDLVCALGASSGISKSEVSRICSELDKEMEAFRARRLDHVAFPYVFCDATYVKARVRGRVVSRAVVVATGVRQDGNREVLGLDVGDSEDGVFWAAFLRSLRERGLSGVRLVVSDLHLGLKEAIEKVFIGASWRRYRVHFLRNALSSVPKARPRWSPPRSGRSSPSPTEACRPAARRRRRHALLRLRRRDAAPSRREGGPVGVLELPDRALVEDLVDEPAGAPERRDQAPLEHHQHLPERRLRPRPRHRRVGRAARRVGGCRTPLPLRGVDGADRPAERRRSRGDRGDAHHHRMRR